MQTFMLQLAQFVVASLAMVLRLYGLVPHHQALKETPVLLSVAQYTLIAHHR